MAFEDPKFKPLGACEDNYELIDDSFRDSWNLYVNSSYEHLNDREVGYILSELRLKDAESYSQAEQEFMDSFVEHTKSREKQNSPEEEAWQKYLMSGIGSLNGMEVNEIVAMLDSENNPNFVTKQFRQELQERRQRERQEDRDDFPYAA